MNTKSAILTLSACLLVAASAMAAPRRPNILHIHTDDDRADGLHFLDNPILKTPNLDALAENGFVFTHAYTMGSMGGAVCTPSRTMLLTGKSWLRIPKPKEGDPDVTLARVMETAGYETFHTGKGGNEYTVGLKAFDTNLIHNDRKPEERRGSSKRCADDAIEFLKNRKGDRPFYIYFAPPVPHDPRVAEPEFIKMYDPAKVPLLPAFMPMHPFDNGAMTIRDERLAPWPRTPENTRQQLAAYWACMSQLDHHVGRILAELKASGEWTDTIVIFDSDNGLSLGEHGLFGKQNLYEYGGMHVPLVFEGPGIPKGRSDAMVYLMDLFPTFADYGGAKLPKDIEGVSLRPIIEGKQSKVRDVLYTAYSHCQRAVRDNRWKLIRYPLVDKTQLFDLQKDPHELNNLAYKPEYAAKVAETTELLKKEMARYGDTTPLKVEHPAPAKWTPPPTKAEMSAKSGKKRNAKHAKASRAELTNS